MFVSGQPPKRRQTMCSGQLFNREGQELETASAQFPKRSSTGDDGAFRAMLSRRRSNRRNSGIPPITRRNSGIPFQRRSSLADQLPGMDWPLRKQHAGFLSHCKAESAMEARFLQGLLEDVLGARFFLDSDDLSDLRLLLEHVRNSDVFLLLQTKTFFTRPWCLLEVLTAIEADVPIISINVLGRMPFQLREGGNMLRYLDTNLNEEAARIFAEHGVDILSAAHKLSSVIPNIISIDFNPSGSRNSIRASILDIIAAMQAGRPIPVTLSFEDWMVSRSKSENSTSETDQVDVFCRFNLFNIWDFDLHHMTIMASFYFEAVWAMPSAAKEGGIGYKSAEEVDWNTAWSPKIMFLNAVGNPDIKDWNAIDPAICSKFDQPMASWRAKVCGRFTFPGLDFRRFPYDLHKFTIVVSSDLPSWRCRLHPNDIVPSVIQIENMALDQWALSCPDEMESVCRVPDRMGAHSIMHPQVSIFHITASRESALWTTKMPAIIFMVGGLGISACSLPLAELASRLQLVAMATLIVVLVKVNLVTEVPPLSYLTFLDRYFLGVFALLASVALQSIMCFAAEGALAGIGLFSLARRLDVISGLFSFLAWTACHGVIALRIEKARDASASLPRPRGPSGHTRDSLSSMRENSVAAKLSSTTARVSNTIDKQVSELGIQHATSECVNAECFQGQVIAERGNLRSRMLRRHSSFETAEDSSDDDGLSLGSEEVVLG